MSREDSQFKLRMPAELREKIEESAKEAKRSLNAEIVARLEESFRISVPRPKSPAINVVEMAKDQKEAFIASIDRSLSMSNSPADLVMLHALRDAAKSELEVIEAQIKS